MYQTFRWAVGVYLCFSPVALLCLMVGGSNRLILLFGLIPGLAFGGISYALMLRWDDFDRIIARFIGSNRVTIAEHSNIKSLMHFIAAYILYAIVIFTLYQPQGVFLTGQFMAHLIMGTMPILAIYRVTVKKKHATRLSFHVSRFFFEAFFYLFAALLIFLLGKGVGIVTGTCLFIVFLLLICFPYKNPERVYRFMRVSFFLLLSLIVHFVYFVVYRDRIKFPYFDASVENIPVLITVFFVLLFTFGTCLYYTASKLISPYDDTVTADQG